MIDLSSVPSTFRKCDVVVKYNYIFITHHTLLRPTNPEGDNFAVAGGTELQFPCSLALASDK